MFPFGGELFLQFVVVGQLTIETEAKPFVFVDVLTLEGLCIAAIILAAGCITDVPDRGATGVVFHDGFAFAAM